MILQKSRYNKEVIATAGYLWITSGSYEEVFLNNRTSFTSLDFTISYIENVMCYLLPWVVNGMIRLMEQEENGVPKLPDWFRLLPQFLQYGVDSRELVWVHSLGIQGRDFAEFILDTYTRAVGKLPETFRGLLDWVLENRRTIEAGIREQWPSYFLESFSDMAQRYEQIQTQLENDV